MKNWNIEGSMIAAQVNYGESLPNAKIFVTLRRGSDTPSEAVQLPEPKIENLDDRGFIARTYTVDGSNVSVPDVQAQDLYLDYLVHT